MKLPAIAVWMDYTTDKTEGGDMQYDQQRLPVRPSLAETHKQAFKDISGPGSWWSGAERIAIVEEARQALHCSHCIRCKDALSPYTVEGHHQSLGVLPENVVEIIHRIKTDSGRLTRKWFDRVMASGISAEGYVELVGVLATAQIIDTYHDAIGLAHAHLPEAVEGAPDELINSSVIDAGAWVPLLDVPREEGETVLPGTPNIYRAMGLVPAAISLFFGVMRSHYSLTPYDIDISRAQIEFTASRVSALNQCFY